MLEDRYYMRREGLTGRFSATVILLIALAVVYVFQLVAERWFNVPYLEYLALSSDGLRQGMVWQLFAFQFLHGGWLHLFLNCWAIYVFGRELEEILGAKRYLALYFFSGVMGGLLQAIAGLLIPRWFAGPVVGASAGVFGLIAAYASLHPERPLTLLLFFIIPVTMRAKYLLLFSAIIALLGILFPGGHIAHAAHLGGMIGGMAFVKHALNWHWPQPGFRVRSHDLASTRSRGKGSFMGRNADTESPEEFVSKEVDPILDKISEHGIQSLTERERQILEVARRKIRR